MKPRVVLIDDDEILMAYYAACLTEAGFHVNRFLSVDELFRFLKKGIKGNIAVFIVDMLMPRGKTFEATGMDLETGIYVHNKLREQFKRTPIVIFSLVGQEGMQKLMPALRHTESTTVIRKANFPPHVLSKFIQDLVNLSQA